MSSEQWTYETRWLRRATGVALRRDGSSYAVSHHPYRNYVAAWTAFEPSIEEARVVLRMPQACDGWVVPHTSFTQPLTLNEVHAHMRAEAEAKKLDNHIADALSVAAQVVGAAMQKALDRNKRRVEHDLAPPSVGNVAACHRCSAPTHLQHRNRPTCRPCADLLDARRPDDVDFDEWMLLRRGRSTVEELKALLPPPAAPGDVVEWSLHEGTCGGVGVVIPEDGTGKRAPGGDLVVRRPRERHDGKLLEAWTIVAASACRVLVRERDR